MEPAKLIKSKSHLIPGKLKVTELFFEIPLDYDNPASGTLRIFARSIAKHENPVAPFKDESERAEKEQLPWMIYLQGGPGLPCPSAPGYPITQIILDKGYQMLYLDTRGVGLSSAVTARTLALRGSTQDQADYLKLFRADNIVRDCEAIRKCLTEAYPDHLKKWSVIGQSFGGLCALTYLSMFPEGLREAFTCGGLPAIGVAPEDIYRATFTKAIERNKAYYKKYPEDVPRVHDLVTYIDAKDGIDLTSGGKLTGRRFLTMGLLFGMHGGLDVVHDLILRMSCELEQWGFFTGATLKKAEEMFLDIGSNSIYALLHESCYCEGRASNWAAERVSREFKEFSWVQEDRVDVKGKGEEPLYFSSEMILPFMFDVYKELASMCEVAEILANYEEWPKLYDPEQLARNEVPLYCVQYIHDLYVDYGLSEKTARSVKGLKRFVTNTLYHDAMVTYSDEIIRGLFTLRDDVCD